MISYLYTLEKDMKSILTSNHGSFSTMLKSTVLNFNCDVILLICPMLEATGLTTELFLTAMPSLYYIWAISKLIGIATKLLTVMPSF